ncbi:molybdopterin-binding protein [Alkalibaculum bacchi]|uniref:Molybdopterin-binding protein n=1 Tax=Alkalibaculum bacchi TaxID=645887 RepID=A0A366I4Z8_9FIRM|nr:TOBE domain-containing protein [Alkalibaculum bacchi]RBP63311.1 molybdopterin-binding protein [Alkalibaculum bacchi]
MKISARNQLKGKVVEIKDGAVNAKVTIDLGGGNKITSIITMDSVKELDLQVGSDATAIVKASSVMIGVDH